VRADAAKMLYEKITSLDGFDHSLQIRPNVPNRDELLNNVVDALRDCHPVDERLSYAPSPWHAFFLLWYRLGQARGRGGAVFFRGHNVVDLPCITASLYREDMTEELTRQARLAVQILAYMCEKSEILKMKGDDPAVLARTVAQHYGIRTSLVDVTLDPSVAIFFASTGGTGDAGAVFVFDWEHCQAIDVPIILPPVSPWARRLTIQRGFFLEFDRIRLLGVEDVPFEVRFARMPGFDVRRDGKAYVPWPVGEPEATELISWVKNIAEQNQTISPSIKATIEAHGHTRVLLNRQSELVFGFAPGASLSPAEARERMTRSLWQYMVESMLELETYVNHLCLQAGPVAAERVRYLYQSNRSVFDFFLKQLCRERKEGRFLDPAHTELLRILNHECS